tara:strand:+ start:523 stop:696 length:174 start_codon:yes stop_codon:yes gene_type:complete
LVGGQALARVQIHVGEHLRELAFFVALVLMAFDGQTCALLTTRLTADKGIAPEQFAN